MNGGKIDFWNLVVRNEIGSYLVSRIELFFL